MGASLVVPFLLVGVLAQQPEGWHQADGKERDYEGYYHSVGACRGGDEPKNNAGLKLYQDFDCKKRCDDDDKCTGFTIPKDSERWCETFSSPRAAGDGRKQFVCYMKGQKTYSYVQKGCVHGENLELHKKKSVEECAELCSKNPKCKAFEYGKDYGGDGIYNDQDCQLQSARDPGNCDGEYHNLDLYIKGGYVESVGACRGGKKPENNAGLKLYQDRECESRCNKDNACTGYVVPHNDAQNWCETYTSLDAKGDGRKDFICYMKVGDFLYDDAEYKESVGACRGGESPWNNAGLKFYGDRGCEKRCNEDAKCTGYVVPVSNQNWCETYTSPGAVGDGRQQFKCYMKADMAMGDDQKNYKKSVGACRGGESPQQNAGLRYYADEMCKQRCDKDEACTGYVIPNNGAKWCETYTSPGAKGDGRVQFTCYTKGEDSDDSDSYEGDYQESVGACRGGDQPENNAGLIFYSDRLCKVRCNGDSKCTGYVVPVSNAQWCETYTSPGAKGDGRQQFKCLMKVGDKLPDVFDGDYKQSIGACRGGDKPQNYAGLRFYRDRMCQNRCNRSKLCTGYVLPVANQQWCETYTSPNAKGDGRKQFMCYMKDDGKDDPVGDEKYKMSIGACRGGRSPQNNAGLRFFRDRSCEGRCNKSALCTGYVVPVAQQNWCETYTSPEARGDGRAQFRCYMKDKHAKDDSIEGYKHTLGACRGGDKPQANAGLRYYGDRNCKTRCDNSATCTGFVLPVTQANWCETYTSKGAAGDKRPQFLCYMKDAAAAPTRKPTAAPDDECAAIEEKEDCRKQDECLWEDKQCLSAKVDGKIESLDAFTEYCNVLMEENDEEKACNMCAGKFKKDKCKLPNKAKKIKCKKLMDNDLCTMVGCDLKKGKKCTGNPKNIKD